MLHLLLLPLFPLPFLLPRGAGLPRTAWLHLADKTTEFTTTLHLVMTLLYKSCCSGTVVVVVVIVVVVVLVIVVVLVKGVVVVVLVGGAVGQK